MVQLAADNAKLACQGFQIAEEVVRNLSAEFNDKIYQIQKDYDNEKRTKFIGKHKPTILYAELTDTEVQRRTGSESKALMMAMIITTCNGDHDIMAFTVTSLTWLK